MITLAPILFWAVITAKTMAPIYSAVSRLPQRQVSSKVYNWNDLPVEKEETRARRPVLTGGTSELELLEIHASTVPVGKAPHASHTHDDVEELIIVKEGRLEVTIRDQTRVLGEGGIALAMPGEEHGFVNGGEIPVTYFILKFKSKVPQQNERAIASGGSFMIDWNEAPPRLHDRGSRRNFFDKATAMFARFEMHVTSLNQGKESHAPHTHRAEEIILIRSGEADMIIGDTRQKASAGALVFLGSQVPHALVNIGGGPCEYYAFQWNN